MTDRKTLGIAPSPATLMEHGQKAVRDLQDRIGGMKMVDLITPEEAAGRIEMGYSSKKIACNRGPTYEFWGKLLGEYSTDPQRKKSKWTEIRLWETPSGQWVAESAGCSDEPGHVDIADAVVIRGPIVLVERQTLKEFEDKTPRTLSMEFQAMDFWGWSSPAKALAKKLGWDLKVQVE